MPETEWNRPTTSEEGAIVFVLAVDDWGQYVIPFPVVFRDDSWWNARTREEVDAFIAGWRPADNVERRCAGRIARSLNSVSLSRTSLLRRCRSRR